MRIPNRLFSILERAYLAQRRIRREENRRKMELEDQAARWAYARLEALHAAGACGGKENGCRYYPCLNYR